MRLFLFTKSFIKIFLQHLTCIINNCNIFALTISSCSTTQKNRVSLTALKVKSK